ncbi:RNA polymerase sigma factor [Alteromonas lipolytica]|uniref:RNA polymerase sigma-70 ECF-like HTH domain-containing protein n=1 Tax=Alteromonas lipolytica TaxID=1856405 RepID=A0A1E8FD70_9ALTE|nr:sigma-70 family RNA polymerase sigma factor [Alteromonas lipolytica]OFI33887.1 hypothetical protein BFC17_20185 [Alteromonas lipolytica]GGF67510.1 hypothetical protein GCM10011338_19610 [Alteromonas lipolytica]
MDEPAVLVRQIAQGNKAAEQKLLCHFFRPLYSIVAYKCDDPTLAQDIVQEALLVVILKARNAEIENPDAIAGFVRRVAENLMIASFRKTKRQRTDTCEDIDLTPHTAQLTETRVSSEKLLETVKQVLAELTVERDKELLRAYFFEGREKHELCDQLDLSTEHFDKVLHRAKARLKQALALKCNVELSKQSLFTLLSVFTVVCLLSIMFNK